MRAKRVKCLSNKDIVNLWWKMGLASRLKTGLQVMTDLKSVAES
jgi:hypothetical protein